MAKSRRLRSREGEWSRQTSSAILSGRELSSSVETPTDAADDTPSFVSTKFLAACSNHGENASSGYRRSASHTLSMQGLGDLPFRASL